MATVMTNDKLAHDRCLRASSDDLLQFSFKSLRRIQQSLYIRLPVLMCNLALSLGRTLRLTVWQCMHHPRILASIHIWHIPQQVKCAQTTYRGQHTLHNGGATEISHIRPLSGLRIVLSIAAVLSRIPRFKYFYCFRLTILPTPHM